MVFEEFDLSANETHPNQESRESLEKGRAKISQAFNRLEGELRQSSYE